MAQEGWICPRCGKVNAPWVMQCSCNRNTQILPKVGAPYYEGDQATCNHMEDKQCSKVTAINIIIKKKNQLRKHKERYISYINIDEVLVWLNDIQKELED